MIFKYKRTILPLCVLVFICMHQSVHGQMSAGGRITKKSHPLLASLFSVAQTAKGQGAPSAIAQRSIRLDEQAVEIQRGPADIKPGQTISTISSSIMCSLCQEERNLECIRQHCTNDELPSINIASSSKDIAISSMSKQPTLHVQTEGIISNSKPLSIQPVKKSVRSASVHSSLNSASPAVSTSGFSASNTNNLVNTNVFPQPTQKDNVRPVQQLNAFSRLFTSKSGNIGIGNLAKPPIVRTNTGSIGINPSHTFPGVNGEHEHRLSSGTEHNHQGVVPVTFSDLTSFNANTANAERRQNSANPLPVIQSGHEVNIPSFSGGNVNSIQRNKIIDNVPASSHLGEQNNMREATQIEVVPPFNPIPRLDLPTISLPGASTNLNTGEPLQSDPIFSGSNPTFSGFPSAQNNLPLNPIPNIHSQNDNFPNVNIQPQDNEIRPLDIGQPIPIVPGTGNVMPNQDIPIPRTSPNSDAPNIDRTAEFDPLPSLHLPGEMVGIPVANNNLDMHSVNTATGSSSSNTNVENHVPIVTLPSLDSGLPLTNTELPIPSTNELQPPVNIQQNQPHRVMKTLSEFFPDGFVELETAPPQTNQNLQPFIEVPPPGSENNDVFNMVEQNPVGIDAGSVAISNRMPTDAQSPVTGDNAVIMSPWLGRQDLMGIDQQFVQRNPVDLTTLIMSPFGDTGQQQNTPDWNSHFFDLGFGTIVPQQVGVSTDITLPGGVQFNSIIDQTNDNANVEVFNNPGVPLNTLRSSNIPLNTLNNNQAQPFSFDTSSATNTFRHTETMTMEEFQQILSRNEPSPITNANGQMGGSGVPFATHLTNVNGVNNNLNVNSVPLNNSPINQNWQFENAAVGTSNGAGQFINVNNGMGMDVGTQQQIVIQEEQMFTTTTPLPTMDPIRARELNNWSKNLLGSFRLKK